MHVNRVANGVLMMGKESEKNVDMARFVPHLARHVHDAFPGRLMGKVAYCTPGCFHGLHAAEQEAVELANTVCMDQLVIHQKLLHGYVLAVDSGQHQNGTKPSAPSRRRNDVSAVDALSVGHSLYSRQQHSILYGGS